MKLNYDRFVEVLRDKKLTYQEQRTKLGLSRSKHMNAVILINDPNFDELDKKIILLMRGLITNKQS